MHQSLELCDDKAIRSLKYDQRNREQYSRGEVHICARVALIEISPKGTTKYPRKSKVGHIDRRHTAVTYAIDVTNNSMKQLSVSKMYHLAQEVIVRRSHQPRQTRKGQN